MNNPEEVLDASIAILKACQGMLENTRQNTEKFSKLVYDLQETLMSMQVTTPVPVQVTTEQIRVQETIAPPKRKRGRPRKMTHRPVEEMLENLN